MEKFKLKNNKGLKIIGEILKPENPIGLSFVLHGLGGYREQKHIKVLADTLFENNYIVVNFDATNSIGESEGKYENATMQNHYDDLVDVIKWTKTKDWYKEPFVLAGHSLGGFAITKYAEEFSNEIKALFPYAALYSGKDSFESSKKLRQKKIKDWEEKGWTYRNSTSKPGVKMRLPWSHMVERLNHNLKLKINNISMPILFVAGEEDKSCPPYQQKEFYNLLPKNTKKEIHIIKNAEHTFREPEQLKKLKEIFNNWLKVLK